MRGRGRSILNAIGLAVAALGAFWMLQGLGVIRWIPSPMVDDQLWVTVGSGVAVIGLFLVLIARRFRW